MAEERFINYFEFAGLDPGASRETNYELLRKMYDEMSGKPSEKAKTEARIIDQAMDIFKNEQKYQAYLGRWRQRQAESPQPGSPAQAGSGAQAGSEGQAGDSQTGAPPQTMGATAVSLGLKLLKKALENRMDPARQGMSGRWRDVSGCFLMVRQQGGQVMVEGRNGFGYVLFQGQGITAGSQVECQVQNAIGQFGQGRLVLAPDGSHMQGQVDWFNGYGVPVGSSQMYLVRA